MTNNSLDLLVFGVDGFDPILGSYFMEKGHLPAFDSVEKGSGSFGTMASRIGNQEKPHTGPAWISLYTGKTEREHGVTLGGWIKGDVVFPDHYHRSVFADLIQDGYTVGSAFMPITYPAEIDTENGSWMVSGFPAAGHLDRVVEPSSLLEKLPESFSNLQSGTLVGDEDEKIASVKEWRKSERTKVNQVLQLIMDSNPTDILFYGTQICDAAGHRYQPYPPYIDAFLSRIIPKINEFLRKPLQRPRLGTLAWNRKLKSAYKMVDETLQILLRRYNPERVLVVSDHGFARDGSSHTFLGTSLADGLYRPEYITEVKQAVLEALDIKETIQHKEISDNDELPNDEKMAIESRLRSLGYSE